MEVVFLTDVEGVAQGGEVKEVRNGFARNYLIPQQLAAPATHNNLQRIKKLTEQAKVDRLKILQDMKELASAIDGTEITIPVRAGANGRLYGSVTGTMIADQVSEITGRTLERRLVQLDDPIRDLGTFEVPVRLHPEVSANISVIVHADGEDPISELEEAEISESITEVEEVEISESITEVEETTEQIVADSDSNIETDDPKIS
ncbi:MAG: 50S ribosomal protein L9 [Chloroflexi bacterium]|nr:50S ribosomal protein L9 [Chloroflexota bacterium]|tara:strand:+ start:1207 stop:1818 length:612 start_codon:yes stop_codon:yes gene_type:complete